MLEAVAKASADDMASVGFVSKKSSEQDVNTIIEIANNNKLVFFNIITFIKYFYLKCKI